MGSKEQERGGCQGRGFDGDEKLSGHWFTGKEKPLKGSSPTMTLVPTRSRDVRVENCTQLGEAMHMRAGKQHACIDMENKGMYGTLQKCTFVHLVQGP